MDGLVQKQTFHAEHHVLPLEQPVLRPFLTKFKDHQLSDDFEPDVCLRACYQSAVRVERHSKSVPCIAKALNLLRLIWGPEVKGNLGEVNGWFADNPSPLTDTEKWLKAKLLLDQQPLLDKLTAIYAKPNPAIQLDVSKITALLQANGKTFFRIWPRFSDDNDGLEELGNRFKAQNLTNDEQRQWNNLLAATYGVIAWRFWQQANLAVQLAQELPAPPAG